jgi:hypothetical protein
MQVTEAKAKGNGITTAGQPKGKRVREGIDCNASKQPISNVVIPNQMNEYRHG